MCALEELSERNFMDKVLHVHAIEGDVGVIQEVDGLWATVTWERTGTTTDCHFSEFRPAACRMPAEFDPLG